MRKHFISSNRGEKHHSAKLTNKKVKAMRKLHFEKGMCIKCLSIFYDVKYTTAWDVVSYNTWKHVKD